MGEVRSNFMHNVNSVVLRDTRDLFWVPGDPTQPHGKGVRTAFLEVQGDMGLL